jgi:hypothetical protein
VRVGSALLDPAAESEEHAEVLTNRIAAASYASLDVVRLDELSAAVKENRMALA